MNPERKLVSFADIASQAEKLRRDGKRIVTTNGCFDLLHWGHIKYLAEARASGDVLWCGVNADVSVKRLKGADRPFWSERVRALQLAGLESVDYVSLFSDDTPEAFLRAVRPAVHVKGGDYEGKEIPEKKLMAELGGSLAFVSFVPGFSTTSMIERIKAGAQPG